MKSTVVTGLLLAIAFAACQPSYPTISYDELQQFIHNDKVERIVIENDKVAYIDIKNARKPYDYKMTFTSADVFHDKIQSYYAASNLPKEEWVYAVFENRSNDSLRSMVPYFAILTGIVVYLVPALIVIWIIRLLRRIDRNLQEINRKLS